ncbi:transcription termination factor MTERF2, chloroplastic isoform X2 [Prosopis cineraria]|uniref:transcription termination factor MTERF2, chloroplastic isoform X2 n=1 Tax=Prosopis cineraria TaxID=364024 RepID=UPI00240FB8BF|nr:transcription termination factor MTERF2, chloroplastic isoform X2 [Prosopis cineraria]
MLSCQKYKLHSPRSLLLQSLTTPISTIVNCQNPHSPDSQNLILRKQNSKSSAFLLHQLSLDQENHHSQHFNLKSNDLQHNMPDEEKIKLLELSLVRKRTPQFPGSIYVQSPSDPDVGSSLPPLRTLFREKVEGEGADEEEMIMRAIEIRRKVTREIFIQAMRKGKFGITYATNLVNRLTGFIDYIMIEAASMKRIPEYSHSTFNLRAKTVIDDSQVVHLIRWLKHNALSYHRISKLILMSRGNLESIRRLAEWLKSVHVKGEFLGVTLVNAGDNVLERSDEELDEIVEYLESKGVRRDWMGYVISRCPQLLSYSMEEVKTRVKFYIDMGLNDHDFGTMVFDYPKVLGHFTLEEMNQKVSYLKEFGLKTEDVGRLLAFKPQLMGCSIEEGWKPLAKYLYYFGITRDGMRRMLMIKPMVFCIDLQTTIVPKVKFFQDIGIRDDAIGNMLVKFPTLLTYSLYKKIRPVVIFLMTKAGVSDKDIAKAIALGPELLGCSITHKLEVNVKYYLSLGIRFKQLGEMIADFPMLLRYNIDILRPKYSYLRRTMVRPLEDLIEFPSYSLNGRIIPRHKVLVENRINLKLRYMLACSDEEFRKLVDSKIRKRHMLPSAGTGADITDPQTN